MKAGTRSRYTLSMRLPRPLLALLAALVAMPAMPQASDPVYHIEIIVFRTGGSSGDAGGLGLGIDSQSSGDDSGGGGIARLIGPLAASSLQLGDIAARLRASGAYRPIAHAGWAQTPSRWGSRSGFSLGRVGVNAEGLAGTAYLERGQYLHLGFSINLGGATINEIRRIRLGEKNYFDNPEFGVIAMVTAAR